MTPARRPAPQARPGRRVTIDEFDADEIEAALRGGDSDLMDDDDGSDEDNA